MFESPGFHDLVIRGDGAKEVFDEVDFFRGGGEGRLEGFFDAFCFDVEKVFLFDDFDEEVFDFVFDKLFIEVFDYLVGSRGRIFGSFV